MPPEPLFAGRGIDRADALRGKSEALAKLAGQSTARALEWNDGAPAIDGAGRLRWQPVGRQHTDLFLGLDGSEPRFSAIARTAGPTDIRRHATLLAQLDAEDAPLFAAALGLANWHGRHPFCSACGQASEPARGGWSRRCAGCGVEHFPRVDPVVIMLAEHDGRLLLGRQPGWPEGRYSALAGFVEPGETIEAAVARELNEEAGIDVADIRYVASQPWPFPSSLMIACVSRALGSELIVDRSELDDARWFTREEVAAAVAGAGGPFDPPGHFAIARTLLDHWLAA